MTRCLIPGIPLTLTAAPLKHTITQEDLCRMKHAGGLAVSPKRPVGGCLALGTLLRFPDHCRGILNGENVRYHMKEVLEWLNKYL